MSKRVLAVFAVVVLGFAVGCRDDDDDDAGTTYYDWPDESLPGFPAWSTLDGRITEIKNMEGVWDADIGYMIRAEIDDEVGLVNDYIALCMSQGYVDLDDPEGPWTVRDVGIMQELFYCPNPSGPFGTCVGENFLIRVASADNCCAGIVVDLFWNAVSP